MADRIQDLLYRRSDLSTFLVHFTRGTDVEAFSNLFGILKGLVIEARHAYGMASKLDGRTMNDPSVTQRTVCFTDTPLEHCWMMVREIEQRGCQFRPYGVAFTKGYARSRGCNPVWYMDQTPGYTWLTGAVDRMTGAARRQCDEDPGLNPATLDILKITPFFEQSGEGKDFAWEREWRCRGDFHFQSPYNVMAVFAPEVLHPALKDVIAGMSPEWMERKVPVLDPDWGLERMLVAMSGVAR
ncbi:abortive infection system antitoxin AbiGi family protein [Nocardia sp. NPDC057272]|uniref:abortive infection system antitoxin AbiGi family protein n=1 Tax=Nocardia sp. NPDC057272 TaxID=3346079 RepID=UPI00363664E6